MNNANPLLRWCKHRSAQAALLAFFLSLMPSSYAVANDFIDMAVGPGFVCGLDSQGAVECGATSNFVKRATPPSDLPPLVHIAAGDTDICGIDREGDVHCWGTHFNGKYEVPADLLAYESLSIGDAHWCGVTTTRNIHCEGNNSFGEATPPEPFTAYNQVYARWQSTCGRRADNSVHCWGDAGPSRQDMTPFTGPLVYMMPENRTSCGIDGNDQVVCDGMPVPGLNGSFQQMIGTDRTICAIEYNGGVQCAIDPDQLNSAYLSPELFNIYDVPSGTDYAQVDGRSDYFACARTYAGDIDCWGYSADDIRVPGSFKVLQTPGNFRAEIYGSNLIELFWDAEQKENYYDAPKIRAYEVLRDDELVLTTNARSYIDFTLKAGDDYIYQVRALGFDSASASSLTRPLIVNTLPNIDGGSGVTPQERPVPPVSELTVAGFTISWPNDGWYQVQDGSTYQTVCEAGRSCTVAAGSYTVINHTIGKRWSNIIVSGDDQTGVSLAPVVSGKTISWQDDGWYQVQNAFDYTSLCEGGLSCDVASGTYNVINLTSGKRWLVTVE